MPSTNQFPEAAPAHVANENIEYKQAFATILFATMQLLIFALITSLKSKTCRNKCSKQNSSPSGRYFFVSFIVALSSFYINCVVVLYIVFCIERISVNENWQVFIILSSLPYDYGRLVMEIFYILRLYFIFGETASNTNPYILTALVIASIISFCLSCIGSITIVLQIWQYKENEFFVPSIFTCSGVIIGGIVSGVVIYLFIRTLHQMNVQMAYNSNSEVIFNSEQSVDNMEIELRDQHIHMIGLITKNTLLGIISLTSTFLVYGAVIIEWMLHAHMDPLAFRIMKNFDGAINSICMCLIFSWSGYVYNTVCNCCDGQMRKCGIWITQKAVRRQISQSDQSN
eukprot:427259_1